jgi:hypothetical protein
MVRTEHPDGQKVFFGRTYTGSMQSLTAEKNATELIMQERAENEKKILRAKKRSDKKKRQRFARKTTTIIKEDFSYRSEPSSQNEDDDDKLCIICMNENRSHVIVPCGHMCLCENCANVERCPLCRVKCNIFVKVFM